MKIEPESVWFSFFEKNFQFFFFTFLLSPLIIFFPIITDVSLHLLPLYPIITLISHFISFQILRISQIITLIMSLISLSFFFFLKMANQTHVF